MNTHDPREKVKKLLVGDAGLIRVLTVFALIAGAISYGLISSTFSSFTGAFASSNPVGVFETVSRDGKAIGWALDPDALTSSINLVIWVDGPPGTKGVRMYTTTTSVARTDVNQKFNTTGNHGFSWTIPSELRDGKEHKLYVQALDKAGSNTPVVLYASSGTSTFAFNASGTAQLTIEKKNVVSPVRLFSFNILQDKDTGENLKPEVFADKFESMVVSRAKGFTNVIDGKNVMDRIRAAGFDSEMDMVYFLDDGWVGPLRMHSIEAQNKYCTSSQRSFKGWTTHHNQDRGDFCMVHDSILAAKKVRFPSGDSYFSGKTFDDFKFDHDSDEWLDENRKNPNPTPRIFATEEWFVHKNKSGSRTLRNGQTYSYNAGDRQVSSFAPGSFDTAVKYKTNLGNKQVQEFIAGRYLRELRGGRTVKGDIHVRNGAKAAYMDVTTSWWDASRWGPLNEVKEFDNNVAFADQMYEKVCTIANVLKKHNYSLEASNFFEPYYKNGKLIDLLECMGGMHTEKFASLGWNGYILPTADVVKQFVRFDEYIKQGKKLALTSGTAHAPGTAGYDKDFKYLLSAYLMLADGENVSFYLSSITPGYGYWNYYHFKNRAEINAALGAPIEDRRVVGTATEYKFERKFECGVVTSDLVNKTGNITLTAGCTPGVIKTHGVVTRIGGLIYDFANQPVPNVTVKMTVTSNLFRQYTVTTKTGADGKYAFSVREGDQYTLTVEDVPTGFNKTPLTASGWWTWNHCVSPKTGLLPPTGAVSGETPYNSFAFQCQKAGNMDCGSVSPQKVDDRCNFKLKRQ